METVRQIIFCVAGTLAFAVTMNAPRKSIKFIAVGALITATTERFMVKAFNDFISCLAAMLLLVAFCEIAARLTKQPTTVILMPSTIPLLPGSAIYYTMLYAIQGNRQLFQSFAEATLLSGLGIAMGALLGSTIIKIVKL